MRTRQSNKVIVAKTGSIIDDDDKTAYDIWTAYVRINTVTSTQSVQKLNSELDRLRYGEGEDFDKFLFTFMEINGRLAAVKMLLSDGD